MDRLAEKLTIYLLKKQVITQDDFVICRYGFQVGLEVILNVAASIVLAVYFQMLPECLIFFLIFIPLRAYAGGLHLNTYWKCFLCSVGTLEVILLFVKYVKVSLAISFIGILVAIFLISRIGPMDYTEESVDSDEMIFFSEKLKIILTMIFLAAVICLLLGNKRYLLLIMCVLWLMTGTLILTKRAVVGL